MIPSRVKPWLPWAAPLLFALPAIAFEARVFWLALHEPFGRDQGIFQYVSFALASGQRDYVDLHDINGPFVHLLYYVLYRIGGADELVIRAVDFALTGVVFFFAGATLPGVGVTKGDPIARVGSWKRVVWGLAGTAMLWGNLLRYNWWDHTQRETFYDLCIVAALSAQLLAQIPSALSDRARAWLFVASGAMGVMPSFGKPTCLLYLLGQAAGIWLDDEAPLARKRALRAFAIGALLGAAPILAFVAVYGDFGAMIRSVLIEGPKIYRHIWHKSFVEAWTSWGNAPRLNYGVVTAALLVPLGYVRLLPRRALAHALFLVFAIANFFLQGKMFPYHLHPITCAAFLLWLLAFAVLVERADRRVIRFAPPWAAWGAALVAACVLSWHCAQEATGSQTAREFTSERLAIARRGLFARDHELAQLYNGGDYFPWDLRRAGWFIRDLTAPEDRVQVWGLDPYVLFFAQRLSATPFIYSFEINVDAEILGGKGGKPPPPEAEELRAMSAAKAHAMYVTLREKPPAAFVTIDNQPFLYPQDADDDFRVHCPEAHAFMIERYARVRRFGAVRVWVRNDLVAKVPPLPAGSPDQG